MRDASSRSPAWQIGRVVTLQEADKCDNKLKLKHEVKHKRRFAEGDSAFLAELWIAAISDAHFENPMSSFTGFVKPWRMRMKKESGTAYPTSCYVF